MIRYKQLKEYDPKMMRALYRGGKTKDHLSPIDMHDDYTKKTIETMGRVRVNTNDKSILPSNKFSRAVLYNGKIYSVDAKKGVHLNIIAWLILNEGMRISSDAFLDWPVINPSDIPFICLHIDGSTNEILFSESYVKRDSKALIKSLNSSFKREKLLLEKLGGVFTGEFYKSFREALMRYNALDEMSADKLQKEVIKLYNAYVGKYKSLTEVVNRISKKLDISVGTVLQILQSGGLIDE